MTNDHDETRNPIDRAAEIPDDDAASIDLSTILELRVEVHPWVERQGRRLRVDLEAEWNWPHHLDVSGVDSYRGPHEIVSNLVEGVKEVHRAAVEDHDPEAIDTIRRRLWIERVLDRPQPDVLRGHWVYELADQLAFAVHQECRLNAILNARATFESMVADLVAAARNGDPDRARALLPRLKDEVDVAERELTAALAPSGLAAAVSQAVRYGALDRGELRHRGVFDQAELLHSRARSYERVLGDLVDEMRHSEPE